MRASWITTAEQVVGIAQTRTGLQSIAEQLNTDLAEAEALACAARAKLPEATRRRLESSGTAADRAYGALPPNR